MFKTLLSRFADSPALVAESQVSAFEGCLSAFAKHPDAHKVMSENMGYNDDGFWPDPTSWRAAYRPYIVQNGILHIPVRGVLLSGFPFQFGPYATGYQYIWRAYQRGLEDGNVKGIALLSNSPGGEVAEAFDLADRMFAARGRKPARTFAHEYAFSAAYLTASSTDRIDMSRTGGVGSIGVLMTHVDVSKMMEDIGWKITFISAPEGGHKTDGNSYEPLKPEVRARWQKRAESLYDLFVTTVARNRGMNEEDVRATKALTFSADEAIENRLADGVASLEDAMAAFAADLSNEEGHETMSNKDTETTAAANAANEAAVASARAEGKSEGVKEGATGERARITAILDSEAGKARPKAALSAALKTDMTADQAIAFLTDLPEEAASAPKKEQESEASNKQKFDEGMKKDAPNVGADAKTDDEFNVVALGKQFGIGGLREKSA